jgi:hypothetical protein
MLSTSSPVVYLFKLQSSGKAPNSEAERRLKKGFAILDLRFAIDPELNENIL